MPRMWASSSRTDECSVRVGDLHCFRDLANFLIPEQWLDSLSVTFRCQPLGQTGGVPPRVRHGVVADTFRDLILDSLSLRSRMTNQGHLSHVISGNLDGTRFAIAILHTLRAAGLANLLTARDPIRPNLKCVSSAFASVSLGKARW